MYGVTTLIFNGLSVVLKSKICAVGSEPLNNDGDASVIAIRYVQNTVSVNKDMICAEQFHLKNNLADCNRNELSLF